jgi:hypothetical protein
MLLEVQSSCDPMIPAKRRASLTSISQQATAMVRALHVSRSMLLACPSKLVYETGAIMHASQAT